LGGVSKGFSRVDAQAPFINAMDGRWIGDGNFLRLQERRVLLREEDYVPE
jgi:hypothetical protein